MVLAQMREIPVTRRVAMKNRAVYALAAGMLLLTSCGKSDTNSMQSATPQQAPAPATQNPNQTATPQQTVGQTPSTTPGATPGQAPVQIPTQEQAQAANPMNAQTPAPLPEPPAPFVVPAGTTLPVI